MTNEGILSVFIRAYGIWKIVMTVPFFVGFLFPHGFNQIASGNDGGMLAYTVVEVLWYALWGAMVGRPLWFARLIVPKALQGATDRDWDFHKLQSVVLGVLGGVFVLFVLIEVGTWIAIWLAAWTSPPGAQVFRPHWQQLLAQALLLIVGGYLLGPLGSVVRLWRRARTAGHG